MTPSQTHSLQLGRKKSKLYGSICRHEKSSWLAEWNSNFVSLRRRNEEVVQVLVYPQAKGGLDALFKIFLWLAGIQWVWGGTNWEVLSAARWQRLRSDIHYFFDAEQKKTVVQYKYCERSDIAYLPTKPIQVPCSSSHFFYLLSEV